MNDVDRIMELATEIGSMQQHGSISDAERLTEIRAALGIAGDSWSEAAIIRRRGDTIDHLQELVDIAERMAKELKVAVPYIRHVDEHDTPTDIARNKQAVARFETWMKSR